MRLSSFISRRTVVAVRLFVGIKFFAVTAEPVFTFFGLGIKFFDAFPESPGVILMFQVGNLMGDHVRNDAFGSQRYSPVIIDVMQ